MDASFIIIPLAALVIPIVSVLVAVIIDIVVGVEMLCYMAWPTLRKIIKINE